MDRKVVLTGMESESNGLWVLWIGVVKAWRWPLRKSMYTLTLSLRSEQMVSWLLFWLISSNLHQIIPMFAICWNGRGCVFDYWLSLVEPMWICCFNSFSVWWERIRYLSLTTTLDCPIKSILFWNVVVDLCCRFLILCGEQGDWKRNWICWISVLWWTVL